MDEERTRKLSRPTQGRGSETNLSLRGRVKVGLRSTPGRESKPNQNNPWTSKGRAKLKLAL